MNFNTLEEANQYIEDKKSKHNKYIRNYRTKDDKQEIIKNISKRSYEKIKNDEEKYMKILADKKKYYEDNKERILRQNKEKYYLKRYGTLESVSVNIVEELKK
jgi:hypothetical protein